MKTLKTFLALIAMLLCCTSCFAAVDYDFKVDGICYDITSETDNTVRVTYNDKYDYYNQYTEYSGSVSIPESVTYNGTTYSVTSIGDYAFRYCSGLTSVTIPNSVTSIGGSAFDGCSGLAELKVEEGNATYDSRDNCNAIIETETNELIVGCKSTVIPNSVTSIGGSAFSGCSGLTSVIIPNSVTSIGGYAFYGTAWYDNLSDGVVYINDVLYKYKGTMPSGTSIEIKEGTVSISPSAFQGCSGLTSVIIPNSVTSIGGYAFSGCSVLTSVTIPNSVTSIGRCAFRDCI